MLGDLKMIDKSIPAFNIWHKIKGTFEGLATCASKNASIKTHLQIATNSNKNSKGKSYVKMALQHCIRFPELNLSKISHLSTKPYLFKSHNLKVFKDEQSATFLLKNSKEITGKYFGQSF